MSIRHIVLFKFNDGVSWRDPRAVQAAEMSASHPEHIQEIQEWMVGRNATDRDIAYDFAVIGTFRDRDALDRYMCHPHHQNGVAMWRELSTWAVVDLEEKRPSGSP
ncbi:MAG TPA: Dabb family protein [Pseudonocardiaceae bacterium]|nr:Dabb family protein [Pseudonocardiaceae bacterium]